jgi:large subunit ribosomal protein L3
MKRYHFGGFSASHGTERKHRAPGSQAGYGTDRGHGGNIKKGKRMGGHMGHVRVTAKNHSLVSIDTENNLLVVKGTVPGPAGSYVVVRTSKMG